MLRRYFFTKVFFTWKKPQTQKSCKTIEQPFPHLSKLIHLTQCWLVVSIDTCLFNNFNKLRNKTPTTSKLCITGTLQGQPTNHRWIPTHRPNNVESISMSWYRHVLVMRGIHNTHQESGPHLNIKMSSYQYRDPHVKDKTQHGSPYTGKTSLYW